MKRRLRSGEKGKRVFICSSSALAPGAQKRPTTYISAQPSQLVKAPHAIMLPKEKGRGRRLIIASQHASMRCPHFKEWAEIHRKFEKAPPVLVCFSRCVVESCGLLKNSGGGKNSYSYFAPREMGKGEGSRIDF